MAQKKRRAGDWRTVLTPVLGYDPGIQADPSAQLTADEVTALLTDANAGNPLALDAGAIAQMVADADAAYATPALLDASLQDSVGSSHEDAPPLVPED